MEKVKAAKTARIQQAALREKALASKGRIKGCSFLFNGPSATVKWAAAEKLAKDLGKELYRVDLAAVVSKYIGETEKNLNAIFNKAEIQNYILYFDEADALFGKRSQVKDAHDRYANPEVNAVWNRLEKYPGVVILSTRLNGRLPRSISRCFQKVLCFKQHC